MMDTTTIKIGDQEIIIPVRFEYGRCKYCKSEIIWGKTRNGKNIPIEWDEIKGWLIHFDNCSKK